MQRKKEIIRLLVFILLFAGCTHPLRELERMEVKELPTPSKAVPRPHDHVLIVIDPGHGGDDFGAHSNTAPKYHEKNLNLALSKMVKTFLQQQGFRTEMTRPDDTFVSLDGRAKFANGQNASLFVSLHFNSAPSKEADGIEVYYHRSAHHKERSEKSHLLASVILDNVLRMTKAKSRGVKHGDFAVIRKTAMPAILVEGGFLTNDKEMQKIKDPIYLKQLAWGIALGIANYTHSN